MHLIFSHILWVAEKPAHSRTLKILLVLQNGRALFVLFFTKKFYSCHIVFTLKNKIILKGQESKSAKCKEGKKIYQFHPLFESYAHLLRYTEQVKNRKAVVLAQ